MSTSILIKKSWLASALETLSLRADRLYADFTAAKARRACYRQTMNELHALSDRDLADIGICRADIPRLCREEAAKV